MRILTFVYALFYISFSHGLHNGLGLTPQMGKIYDFVWKSVYEADVFFSKLKDGIPGTIFVVFTMKHQFDK